jgi:hypothetical protein
MLTHRLAILPALCLASACLTPHPGNAPVTRRGDEADVLERAHVQIEGTIWEGDGIDGEPFLLNTRVRIAPDSSAIEFDLTGTSYTLGWDGKDDPDCACRTYADDEFKAVVYFSRRGRGAQARIDRRGNRAG